MCDFVNMVSVAVRVRCVVDEDEELGHWRRRVRWLGWVSPLRCILWRFDGDCRNKTMLRGCVPGFERVGVLATSYSVLVMWRTEAS